jgi:hypothetical protein
MNLFIDVIAKLGNMRKPQEFVVYPHNFTLPHLVILQSDKRIASVNLTTSVVTLSDGKGGHQGFWKLNAIAGAVAFPAPAEFLATLKTALEAGEWHGSSKSVSMADLAANAPTTA